MTNNLNSVIKQKFLFISLTLLLFNGFISFTQTNTEFIKHVVYSQRMLYRTSVFLDEFSSNNEILNRNYFKLFPEYGEFYWVTLNKIDSINIPKHLVYEYIISSRCHSKNDSITNQILKSNPELHFVDGKYVPCKCCNLTGDNFKERIIGINNDCINNKGIIIVDTSDYYYPNVYFISGECVFKDKFEKYYFEKTELNEQDITSLLKLKLWETSIHKKGTKLVKIEKIRNNKYRLFLHETKNTWKLKIKRNKSFKLLVN
jgi:hypothetical protein